MIPITNMLASTKPPSSACQVLIRELMSHSGVANTSVRTSGTISTMRSRAIPSDPGLIDRLIAHSAGHAIGAFQPPKNSVTVSAEMMKTLTYSAKKKNPKRIPEYSVAKPATISESASVRSNGVRFASAVAAMKKIRNASGCCQMYQSVNQPAWFRTMTVRSIVPAIRITPDDGQDERDLVAHDLRGRAQPAEQRVLVEARPAAHQQPDDRQAADREEVQQPQVEARPHHAVGRERDDEQRHHAGQVDHDGRPREDHRIGAGRREVLLRQDLEPVDHRQQRPVRADSFRADPQVHQRDDLHLHVDDQEGRRDGHEQDHRGGDDEPRDRQVRRR